MNNAIEVHNLCKSYPGFSLKNISFTVPEGLCCGFVGPNGAGKSTTLRIMAGLAFPDSGEVRLLGRPGTEPSVKEEIAILFDRPYFQEEWTPGDIEKSLAPFYPGWDSTRYRNCLSRFGLDPGKKFKNLSRGMKQKLAMAVHLSHETKVLLLDEPTGGLDPAARDELLDIFREYLIPEGRTILFSTHITSDLERIADKIIYIQNGSIFWQGDKDILTASYCMVRGGILPGEKKKHAIGLRQTDNGFECLMALEHIGGLPRNTVTERASIDDVVVYMERHAKQEQGDWRTETESEWRY